MKKKSILSVVIVLLMCITACKKYSEGPMLSLRSKAERVANNWRIAQALDNGSDVTSQYNKFELDLSKGGTAMLSAEYTIFNSDFKYTTEGNWVFVSNKEKISFDFENDDADGVYTILRLKEKEMWLKKDGDTVELHLVPR